MARWRLAVSHYIHVDGTEWEYKEMDRVSGREVRKRFSVPRFLDVNDPLDWTEKVIGRDGSAIDGNIIVSDGLGAESSDIIFTGDPTPEMVPLDDAAAAISAKFAGRWKRAPDSPEGNYADGLVEQLQGEMLKLQTTPGVVQVDGMSDLLTALTSMMKQNQELLATLTPPRRV